MKSTTDRNRGTLKKRRRSATPALPPVTSKPKTELAAAIANLGEAERQAIDRSRARIAQQPSLPRLYADAKRGDVRIQGERVTTELLMLDALGIADADLAAMLLCQLREPLNSLSGMAQWCH